MSTIHEELAWCAGLADGEGCWLIDTLTHKENGNIYKNLRPRFEISQNDRKVLDRFLKSVRDGHIYGPWKHSSKKSKPYYRYVMNGQLKVLKITSLIFPWLSPVKKEQIKVKLDQFKKLKTSIDNKGWEKLHKEECLDCPWDGKTIFPTVEK